MYEQRIAKLRELFAEAGIDSLFVNAPANIHYLTGFTDKDSYLVVGKTESVFITDSRFTEEAENTVHGARIYTWKTDLVEEAMKIASDLGAIKMGFESDSMSYANYQKFSAKAGGVTLISTDGLVAKLRVIKSEEELVKIEKAADIAWKGLHKTLPHLKPGVTEADIERELRYNLLLCGAQDVSFPPIIAFDAGASLPHYKPGKGVLKADSLILFDWGARHNFYCSDCTRVILRGKVPVELRKIFDIVHEADQRAIAQLRPGKSLKEVDAAARDYIRDSGYGDKFGHGLGHGVGIEVHEAPRLNPRTNEIAVKGMVVTIEAGIYLPGIGGVRIEDMVAVTETGCRLLTNVPLNIEG